MKKWKSGQAGFSLIEVLVAIGIFSITLAVYSHQFVMSDSAGSKVKSSMFANIILQNLMEDISMRFQEDPSLSQAFNSNHYRYFSANLQESTSTTEKYTARWVVTENLPLQGMKTIEFSVSWQQGTTTEAVRSRMVR